MTSSTQQRPGTRFETVTRLRRVQILQLALKLIGLTIAAYVLLRLARGRPVYPVPSFYWVGLIFSIILVCRLRVGWGTTVVFQDSAVVFFRGASPVCLVQRNTIQAIQHRKNSLIFRYQGDLGSRRKLIGSEGFPREVWLALTEHAAQYVAPTKKN